MGRRWRWWVSVALVVALAVVLVVRASSEHDTFAGPDPRGPTVEAGEDPGAVGSATAVVDLPTPRDADRLCGEGVTAGNPCRITTSLREPDPPERRGPPPEQFDPPASLGQPALLDAADPAVLLDGQTYSVFSTSAAWWRLPIATVPAADLVRFPDGTPGYAIRDTVVTTLPPTTATTTPATTAVDVPHPPSTFPPELDPNVPPRADAMPEQPAWSTDTGIWAPTVARIGTGYVMFFAAKRPNPPDPANAECVGRATSSSPSGPFVPDPVPFTCGLRGLHGALDPSVFRDRDGSLYLHVAFGGTSTPLWVIPLTRAGTAASGAKPLLRMTQRWETWFLENPSMVFDGAGYVLAYSAGDWKLPTYSTGVARCAGPMGPCTSSDRGPWLSGDATSTGAGGLTFFTHVTGRPMAAFHAYRRGQEALFGARHAHIRRVILGRGRIALG